jgi:SAM-dependent methyltransferase
MDLNPKTAKLLDPGVQFLQQDCSQPWPLPEESLDVVFTSNFFEHLPDKASLARTLDQVLRCLKKGGRLIAMGPNARCIPGAYWDFWDHYLPLTERSLGEACELHGLHVERSVARFLPYKMTHGPRYPMWCLKFYLRFTPAWRLFGKQFLVVAAKRD